MGSSSFTESDLPITGIDSLKKPSVLNGDPGGEQRVFSAPPPHCRNNGSDGADNGRENEFAEVLYAVTHDLRAPLVNVRALAEELRLSMRDLEPLADEASADATSDQRRRASEALRITMPETLAHIDQSIAKMDGLMSGLSELARMTGMTLAFAPLDLKGLVDQIVKEHSDHQASASCRIAIGDLPTLRADRTAMEAILRHLIRNAIQYRSPKRPGHIEIFAESRADRTCIVVRDNGRGIAEKDLPRIFSPFRRAGKLDTEGRGMGLAIAKALARRHGASLVCESAPDQGAALILSFPPEASQP